MRQYLFGLIFLIISVWVGMLLVADPGYALFSYRDWSVEMPLWLAVSILFLLILFLYCLLRFSDAIETTWLRIKNWLHLQRKYKSFNKTNRAIVELLEGDFRNAQYYSMAGVNQSDLPLVNYLTAAWAAAATGAYDKCELYLHKAQDNMPAAEIAIDLLRVRFLMERGQLEKAVTILNHLTTHSPRHPAVLKQLEKAYIQLGDWDNLLKLLPLLRKTKLITQEQFDTFEIHIYEELFNRAEKTSLSAVDEVWQSLPRRMQKNPLVIRAYVKKILSCPDKTDLIESLISEVLKKQWDEELVTCYGIIITSNPRHQLARAETWLKQYGYHARLFLTLGRLSLRCQLWGKARSYLEQSLKAGALPEAYLEYGKLLEQLGEPTQAAENYFRGLESIRNQSTKNEAL